MVEVKEENLINENDVYSVRDKLRSILMKMQNGDNKIQQGFSGKELFIMEFGLSTLLKIMEEEK